MRHDIRGSLNRLPRGVWLLAAVYTLASLWHFAHNAEYLAYYPNMPPWITREIVYAAWLAVASVGVVGAWLMWQGWLASGAGVMAAYGALGLDGLAHYGLAPCSAHTWVANLTIAFEVATGAVLMVCAAAWAARQGLRRWYP